MASRPGPPDPPAAAGFITVPPVRAVGRPVGALTAAPRLGIEARAAWISSGKAARPVVPDIHTPPEYF